MVKASLASGEPDLVRDEDVVIDGESDLIHG
jgi:hypothetical protein